VLPPVVAVLLAALLAHPRDAVQRNGPRLAVEVVRCIYIVVIN
jgi:hypothetical protein